MNLKPTKVWLIEYAGKYLNWTELYNLVTVEGTIKIDVFLNFLKYSIDKRLNENVGTYDRIIGHEKSVYNKIKERLEKLEEDQLAINDRPVVFKEWQLSENEIDIITKVVEDFAYLTFDLLKRSDGNE